LLRLQLSSHARIVYRAPSYPFSRPLRARALGPALDALLLLWPGDGRGQQLASRTQGLGTRAVG